MTELKFEHDYYGELTEAIKETRNERLDAASEHYGIPKEEVERQVEQIDNEVRKELTFDERCEIVRRTPITKDMTYEERLATLRRRFGL